MKSSKKFIVCSLLILGILSACEKKEAPTILTDKITDITGTTATCGGIITDEGSSAIIARGVCWSIEANPTIENDKTSDGTGGGVFSSNITGLTGATTYHVRAYATNSEGTSYGADMSFTTLGALPVSSTLAASYITTTSATLNGTVNANYLSTVVSFEYGPSTSYGQTVTAIQNPVLGNANADVSVSILSLSPGTTYHFRVKAVNDVGTTYGNDMTFISLGQVPSVSGQSVTTIKSFSAKLNGIINANFLATEIIFEYGTSISYGSTISPSSGSITGNTDTNISASLTGLTQNTTYHFRIKAENSLGVSSGADITFTTPATMTDYDGNIYESVIIGTQTWLAGNLKTTKLNDGTAIPNIIDDGEWYNLLAPGYAWYNHDENTYKEDYGALYNWYTVNTSNLCPSGWHVPSDSEWMVMITSLGENVAIKLKETGIEHWVSPNAGVTNESGFTGLPGGWRYNGGGFNGINYYGSFWTSTEFNTTEAYTRNLGYGWGGCDRNNVVKSTGFSVRCIKD